MKLFIKIFSIAFLCFMMIFSSLAWAFNHFMKEDQVNEDEPIIAVEDPEDSSKLEPEERDELEELVYNSERVNFVLMGLEGTRSDTMMFVSFDPKTKEINIISIPRDTYYHRQGYDHMAKRKINSVYGDHGANGVKTVLSDVLYDIPIDYYVTVSYNGAAAIINSLGGVPVTISRLMDYTDPYDDPPLRIYFEPGSYVLNGEEGVKFLRYRQATPGSGGMSYANGDLGRISAQQEFIKSALNKAISLRLPTVVSTAFKYVRTDIDLQEIIVLATAAVNIETENIEMTMLPGEDAYRNGASFYFPDYGEVRKMIIEMYGGQVEEPEEPEDSEETPEEGEKEAVNSTTGE